LEACRQSRLDGSWEIKARYRVKHPATLRDDVPLSSQWVAEVDPDQEVVVVDIGVHVEPDDPSACRLRLKVALCNTDFSEEDEQIIGWMSAETLAGDQLLYPVDLLSMAAVDIHRSMSKKGHPMDGAMSRLSRKSRQNGSTVGSALSTLPWKVGGQYRVLEKVPLRLSAALSSRTTGVQLQVGALVTISELQMLECPHLGWCPCAYVSTSCALPKVIQKAKTRMKERRGWIRCAGKDGRNLIDERDQLEFEKVAAKVSTRQEPEKKVTISRHPAELQEIGDRDAAAQNDGSESDGDWEEDSQEYYYEEEEEEATWDGDSIADDESPKRETAAKPEDAKATRLPSNPEDEDASRRREEEFARKLQALEIGGKEEKLVDTNTIITDKSSCFSCDCGAKANR